MTAKDVLVSIGDIAGIIALLFAVSFVVTIGVKLGHSFYDWASRIFRA